MSMHLNDEDFDSLSTQIALKAMLEIAGITTNTTYTIKLIKKLLSICLSMYIVYKDKIIL